ncbi:MAG: hypothetical protein HWE23_05655 [Rhodobacteraceae bacterium]|nr:hypothetical protein [Paracoccaceae bacterium]
MSELKSKSNRSEGSLSDRVSHARLLLAEYAANDPCPSLSQKIENYIHLAFQSRAIPGRVRTRPIAPLEETARIQRCRELLAYWAGGYPKVVDEDLVADISQRNALAKD